jgi:hypothetical protein
MSYKYQHQPVYLQAILDFLSNQVGDRWQQLWSIVKEELADAPPLVHSYFNYWVYNHINVIESESIYLLFPQGFIDGMVYYQPPIYRTRPYIRSRSMPIEDVQIIIPDYSDLICDLERIVGRTGYYFHAHRTRRIN